MGWAMEFGNTYIYIYFIFYYIYYKYLLYKIFRPKFSMLKRKLTTYLLIKIVDQATKIKKMYRPGNVPTAKSPDCQMSRPRIFDRQISDRQILDRQMGRPQNIDRCVSLSSESDR